MKRRIGAPAPGDAAPVPEPGDVVGEECECGAIEWTHVETRDDRWETAVVECGACRRAVLVPPRGVSDYIDAYRVEPRNGGDA